MSWQIGMATGACVDQPILDVVDRIRRTGVPGIEVGTPPRHFDPRDRLLVDRLRDALQAWALPAISIHAPFGGRLDLADPDAHHRRAAVGAIDTAAAALKSLGGRIVVVHPSDLERHHHDPDARLAAAADSLRQLTASARQEDMIIALESPLPHLIGGRPDEFAWLLREVGPDLAVCLDTGHTALGNHWQAFVQLTAGRLVHVHASDNHGSHDDHLPPGDGSLDWRGIADSLAGAGFDGWIMLELRCGEFARAFDQARQLLRP